MTVRIGRLASSDKGAVVRPRRWAGSIAGLLAAGGAAALAGIACCGPSLVLWLAQAVFLVGGGTALVFLVTYEAMILLGMAVTGWFGWRFGPDRWSRFANRLLSGVALMMSLTRLLWDLNADLVVLLLPLYWLFVTRQSILAVLAAIVLGLQVVGIARMADQGLQLRCSGHRYSPR